MHITEQSSTNDWDDLTQRGVDIYQDRLKAMLEPDANGQFVAIHVETGDHAVERFPGGARRSLRRRHPNGSLVTMKIGPEPEYGLSARMTASRGRSVK